MIGDQLPAPWLLYPRSGKASCVEAVQRAALIGVSHSVADRKGREMFVPLFRRHAALIKRAF
jgi:hypothetical protein